MTCASSAMRVERSIKAVPGVKDASVNLATEQVSVSAEATVSPNELAAAVRKAGYEVATKDVTLRIMPLAGGKIETLAKLFGGQGTINVPSWSPDSRRLAFVSYQRTP